jgi:hypothetical protein
VSDPASEEAKQPTVPTLVVKGGPTDGQSLELQQGTTIIVGSGHLAHLRIDVPLIGGAHVKISWDDLGISVTDNGSENGTYVNGVETLTGLLRDGDRISFGHPGKQAAPRVLVKIPPGTVPEPPPSPEPTHEPAAAAGTAAAAAEPAARHAPRPVATARKRPAPRFDAAEVLSALPLRAIGVAAVGLVLLVALVFGVRSFFAGRPAVAAVTPSQGEPGVAVRISGTGFKAEPAGNTVRFGDVVAVVTAATEAELTVTVPEGPSGTKLPVTVETSRGRSGDFEFTMLSLPRLSGLQPEVALPGEEVTARGQNLGNADAKVLVSGLPATVLERHPMSLRFRVPNVPAVEGTEAPVSVQDSTGIGRPLKLVLGRLPLVKTVSPKEGPAGQRVTLEGRGFDPKPAGNVITFGGRPALVLSAAAARVEVLAPSVGTLSSRADLPIVVRAGGRTSSGRALFTLIRPSSNLFRPAFYAAPAALGVVDPVVVWTELGPFLVLSGKADAASLADRAARVVAALNAAVAAAQSGRALSFEAREQPAPGVGVVGASGMLLVATAEDAAAYESPPELSVRGKRPSPAALAAFWAALLDDYFGLFGRGLRPVKLLELTPRARVLLDIRNEGVRRAGEVQGVPASVVTPLPPEWAQKLKELSLLVPAGREGTAAAALEGAWEGTMEEPGQTSKPILVRLRLDRNRLVGSLATRATAVSVDLPLKQVSYENGRLKFVLVSGGSTRHFAGTVDGDRIAGSIHAAPGTGAPIGQFALRLSR